MDKSWVYEKNRFGEKYAEGVRGFVSMTACCVDSRDPCRKCRNVVFHALDKMEDRIYINGFDVSYKSWVFHGEGIQLTSNLSKESGASLPYSDDDLEGDNSDRMVEMLTDVRARLDGGATRVETENPNINETPTWGPKVSTPLNKL